VLSNRISWTGSCRSQCSSNFTD